MDVVIHLRNRRIKALNLAAVHVSELIIVLGDMSDYDNAVSS